MHILQKRRTRHHTYDSEKSGGDEGDRTPYLLNAIGSLCELFNNP
jgi:hypothetical protein